MATLLIRASRFYHAYCQWLAGDPNRFEHRKRYHTTRYWWVAALLLGVVIGLQSPATPLLSLTASVAASQVSAQKMAPTQPKAPVGGRWYMVDTHVHSVFSGDAVPDLGILSQAKAFGYDALFVSDHTGASSFQINQLTANTMAFDESYARWESGTFGALTGAMNELSTTPVNSGQYALHLAAQATTYGESFVTATRGPNLRSGDILLNVSIYPTRIDPGSGLYLSAAIGGDPSVRKTAVGYTNADGVIYPQKSVVFVWQLGAARQPLAEPNQRVYTYALHPYTLNQWNHYTINFSNYLQDLPADERPLSYNALVELKIAAAAQGGEVEGYIDSYTLVATAPEPPATEFFYRSKMISQWNQPDFLMLPAYEMGQQKHVHRLNFNISAAEEYLSYTYGSDGIDDVHLSGYPAIVNHPDVTVPSGEVVATRAFGADLLEVRERGWVTIWDLILQQGTILLGVWSSDAHHGIGGGKPVSLLFAQALTLDELVQAMYEGRSYNADNDFTGRLLLGPDANQSEPYPARYPLYVADTQSELRCYLTITGGLSSGDTIRWIRNGQLMATDPASGATYQANKSISLNQPTTYVRAEVADDETDFRALTQPIFIQQVPELPTGWRFGVTGVETADGRQYMNTSVRGITAARWSKRSKILEVRLENPVAAVTTLSFAIPSAPERVLVNRMPVPVVNSREPATAQSDSSWRYDQNTHELTVIARHEERIIWVGIDFSTDGDGEPPTAPAQPTTPTLRLGHVTLAWAPAVDNTGVQGYLIYRDGVVLDKVEAEQLQYQDTTVLPGQRYEYSVVAFDGADNQSAPSLPVQVSTPIADVFTLTPVADAYVTADAPQGNYGDATMLRLDGNPATVSYLRFTQTGVVGTPRRALLRLYAQSNSALGYQIHNVSSGAWDEATITFESAPHFDPVVAASGPLVAESWSEIDVTSLLQAGAPLALALTTVGDASIRLAARESGALAPTLLIETIDGVFPNNFYLPLIER